MLKLRISVAVPPFLPTLHISDSDTCTCRTCISVTCTAMLKWSKSAYQQLHVALYELFRTPSYVSARPDTLLSHVHFRLQLVPSNLPGAAVTPTHRHYACCCFESELQHGLLTTDISLFFSVTWGRCRDCLLSYRLECVHCSVSPDRVTPYRRGTDNVLR
jgi:hypothetical protein